MHFTKTRSFLAFSDELKLAVPLCASLKEANQFAKAECRPFLLLGFSEIEEVFTEAGNVA